MKILTMNQNETMIRAYHFSIPHAYIRITNPTNSLPKLPENYFLKGELNLKFYDIDSTKYMKDKSLKYGIFTISQANEIIDFVEKLKSSIDVLCCHCQAGISRSAGVSAALALIFNGSNKEIFNNKKFIPNMKVYSMILKAWEEKKDIL